MPGTTPRLLLPYPAPADSVDVPRDIKALADRLDIVADASLTSGLASARPSISGQPVGAKYWCTDYKLLYERLTSGGPWVLVGSAPIWARFRLNTTTQTVSSGVTSLVNWAMLANNYWTHTAGSDITIPAPGTWLFKLSIKLNQAGVGFNNNGVRTHTIQANAVDGGLGYKPIVLDVRSLPPYVAEMPHIETWTTSAPYIVQVVTTQNSGVSLDLVGGATADYAKTNEYCNLTITRISPWPDF